MINKQQIADILLDINAIKINLQTPFKWSSGLLSPIYCDNRRILSFPKQRDIIKQQFAKIIEKKYPSTEAIAAIATGSIAFGALVADTLKLPMVYVRTKNKEYGLKKQIEGYLPPNTKLIVIEDLISTGMNSSKAVEILKSNHLEPIGLIAIFTYMFPEAQLQFDKKNISLITLTDFETLLQRAYEKNFINEQEKKLLQIWHKERDFNIIKQSLK